MRTETQKDYEQRLLAVLVHIQEHLDHALDLDDLAKIANFSPYHFHRIFRGMVGEPVKEHIRRLRLERAAHQLKVGDKAVTEIAFDAGYETHESFTRAFRARFGQAPSGFRESHSHAPLVESPTDVHYSPQGKLESFNPATGEGETMEARKEKLEPIRAAFMRHIGPYNEVGETWDKLCGWAGMKGLFVNPNIKLFGVSYDDPEITPADKIRYDACIAVDDSVQPEGDVGVQTFGGAEYAVTRHRGPYEDLSKTYAALMGQWMPAQGLEPAPSPCLEFYLNNPKDCAPEDLLTDLYVQVKAK